MATTRLSPFDRITKAKPAMRLRRIGRRVPRWLRWVAVAIVGLFVLYLVAANIILRTGLLGKWLSSNEQEMKVTYSSAWSPYPGRVIARDLRMRFQDSNVQFLLEIERCSFDVDLFALPRKKFLVHRLDADHTSFFVRHKVASAVGQEARLAAYPPISGFADPPVRPEPPKEDLPEEKYNLWEIELRDVNSTVKELWIMEYRYRGATQARVTGGFFLRPMRKLRVHPSALVTEGGTLSIGEHDLVKSAQTRLDVDVPEYDVRIPQGAEVFRQFDVRADLKGDVVGLEGISTTYLAGKDTTLEKGSGRIDVVAKIEHGLVRPDSHLEYHTGEVVVRSPKAIVRGDAKLTGRAEEGLAADATIARAFVALGGKDAFVVEGARGSIALDGVDLSEQLAPKSGSLAVEAARAPDLTRLGAILPKAVTVHSGAAVASVRATYDDGALDGRVDVLLDKVRVQAGKVDVTASGKAWSNLGSKDARRAIAFGGSGVELRDVAVRVENESQSGFFFRADANEALVREGSQKSVDADVVIHAGPGDKMLRLVGGVASLPKDIVEAPAGEKFTARLQLHAAGDGKSVRVLEARNGELVARGFFKDAGPSSTGRFLFELGPLRAGLEIENGESKVKPLVAADWLDKQSGPPR